MTQPSSTPPARKPWTTGQKLAVGGGAAFFLLALSTSLLPDPPASATGESTAPRESEVEDLQKAMKPMDPAGQTFAMTIPKDARPAEVEAAAKASCTSLAFCQVYGWHDPAQVATAWPMLDREVAALSFRYALNRNTGYESTDWYCDSIGAKPDCTKADAD